ncbi:uncharacterized protein LOC122569577 [Bombus pyrosoma]|uniref:uncharacterized protein LOC122569577 n=1 Tax=Bombus pyrosoma TaxID=396416 RepID=UPI001CB9249F|nr:uncharacterized protein LOC122569577 [Bombus pyrosoma]
MLWDSGVPHGSRYKRSQFSGGSPRESPVLSLTVYRLPGNDDENQTVRNGFRRGAQRRITTDRCKGNQRPKKPLTTRINAQAIVNRAILVVPHDLVWYDQHRYLHKYVTLRAQLLDLEEYRNFTEKPTKVSSYPR